MISSKFNIDVYILYTDCPEIRIYKKEHFNKFEEWIYSIYPNICLSRKRDKAFSLICKWYSPTLLGNEESIG